MVTARETQENAKAFRKLIARIIQGFEKITAIADIRKGKEAQAVKPTIDTESESVPRIKESIGAIAEKTYMPDNNPSIQKKPSTSEVIDWIRALELGGVPSYKIKETVPFAGVLLKKNEDIDTMRKFLK